MAEDCEYCDGDGASVTTYKSGHSTYWAPPGSDPPKPYNERERCQYCEGTGKQIYTGCPTCEGRGQLKGPLVIEEKCPRCQGKGSYFSGYSKIETPCELCKGKGLVSRTDGEGQSAH
jgi:DnaJ-class molecular chaperone